MTPDHCRASRDLTSLEWVGLRLALERAVTAALYALRVQYCDLNQLVRVSREVADQTQRVLLLDALERHRYNLTHTAKALHIASTSELLSVIARLRMKEQVRKGRGRFREIDTVPAAPMIGRLIELLSRKGWSPSRLSVRAGLHKARVGVLMAHARRSPKARVKRVLLSRLAAAGGVTVGWLAGESERGGTESTEQQTASRESP